MHKKFFFNLTYLFNENTLITNTTSAADKWLAHLPEAGFRSSMFVLLSGSVKRTQCVRVLAISEVKALVHQRIIFHAWSQVLFNNPLYVSEKQSNQPTLLLAAAPNFI